jgi:signal transduction histidine kinase/ActR/RegA family two-component response regulator
MASARTIAARLSLSLALGSGAARAGLAPSLAGSSGMPPLRVFTARDTGASTMAWSAAQDQAGRMYFGCDTVISFDGDQWHPEPMDPTYLVRGLDVGPNGRIWAAAVNQVGWFGRDPRGTLAYHSLMDRLPAASRDLGDVWKAYAEGPDAAVFVAHGRVLRWDGVKFDSWELPGMQLLWSTRTARAIYVDYPPLGLLRIGAGGPEVAVPAGVIGTSAVGWLDDSGPDWLLMTPQGFKLLRAGKCTALDTPASSFVRSNTATSAVRLPDGTLAVATLKGGIAVVSDSGDILRLFNLRTGLPSNQVYSLFVDRDGALWGMGPAHIFRLGIGSGSALYTQQSGYPAAGSDALDAADGSLFIASHSDILRLGPGPDTGGAGQFEGFGMTSSRLYSLLRVPQGLAVGHLHGLSLWAGGAMRPIGAIDEPVYRTSQSRSRPGRILASLTGRVVSVDPATGQTEVVAQALPDYGDTIAEEASGRLWIGTPSRGLFVAEPGHPEATPAGPRFGFLPAEGPAFVTMAGPDVIALTRKGAFFLGGDLGHFRGVAGFPGGTPSAISNPDAAGSVWAALYPDPGGHSPKVGRIAVGPRGAEWLPQSIEGLSGVGSLLALRVVGQPGAEDLWMAGTEALLRAGPSARSPRPPPRRPLMRAWAIADEAKDGAPLTGVLPYATRGVHFEYSSVDYGMRESERFETLLGGAETEWSPPGESPEREISGLREGSYDFRVRLVTDSGEAGEAADVHFDIAPPWWRTAAARAAFAAAAFLAILGLLRLRTRALKQRAQVLERMVRQRTDELEKANAAKTEFVTSMSHEIRNPMGGILASALELAETPLEPGQRRLVSTLQSCASFLASLVEDVLDFAAIEAGAYTVTRAPLSPRDVLETVVMMLGPRAAPGSMGAAVAPDLPERIVGDAARIQQVMVNFAVNSLKFGGRAIWLSARADGDHVLFTVADDGVGVPAEEQKNLFIRFSRLKPAVNSAIPGTGLGLAVCRALAERMGGTVGFASAPGGGSIFTLRLPLEAADAAGAPGPAYEVRGMSALVVEDIDYNARALGLMLGRMGFEVTLAADGEAALDRLASKRFSAVFLDCNLPGVGGLEVARRLRAAEPPGTRALVVATTALSTAADRDACIAAGMDAFVTKPITPAKLGAALAALTGPCPQWNAPVRPAAAGGIDLGILSHLGDGTAAGLDRELGKFAASLDEALRGVGESHASGSRAGMAAAAHRVLSLARIVGAESLAGTAADLQDYAAALSDSELASEVAALGAHAAALRGELEALAEGTALSSYRAS